MPFSKAAPRPELVLLPRGSVDYDLVQSRRRRRQKRWNWIIASSSLNTNAIRFSEHGSGDIPHQPGPSALQLVRDLDCGVAPVYYYSINYTFPGRARASYDSFIKGPFWLSTKRHRAAKSLNSTKEEEK